MLSGRLISSEQYAFPLPAASTGDGSTHIFQNTVITSERYLHPDDDRISDPVNVTWTRGGIRLWTALDSAVRPRGDTADRDGAAWFAIDPVRQQVTSFQGYVAARSAYLLYPAVLAPRFGRPAMVFTVTGDHIDPAAAFTTLGSDTIRIVAPGSGPHESFSDTPPFNQARWGDYSRSRPLIRMAGASGWRRSTSRSEPFPGTASTKSWGTLRVRGLRPARSTGNPFDFPAGCFRRGAPSPRGVHPGRP